MDNEKCLEGKNKFYGKPKTSDFILWLNHIWYIELKWTEKLHREFLFYI